MQGAKVVDLPLDVGSVYWDGQYTIGSTLINMIIDNNGCLCPIPVPKILYEFKDYNEENPRPVNILSIKRTSTRPLFKEGTDIWNYISTYMILTTSYSPQQEPTKNVNITYIQLDEQSNDLARPPTYVADSTGVDPKFLESIKNPPAFYCISNGQDIVLFSDDYGNVFFAKVQTSSIASQNPELLNYSKSRAWLDTGDINSRWIDNSLNTTAVEEWSSDGSINYHKLMKEAGSIYDSAAGYRRILVNVLGYGLIYDSIQKVLFMTEYGDFSKIKWLKDKAPVYSSNSTVKSKGVPYTRKIPYSVVDIKAENNNIIIWTADNNCLRYNLIFIGDTYGVADIDLQQDYTFNAPYKGKFGGCALLQQGLKQFATQDDKLYAINAKNNTADLTERGIPGKPYFEYNFYTNESNERFYFYIHRIPFPIKILGMECFITNYALLNLQNANQPKFSFLIPNKKVFQTWVEDNLTYTYDQPQKITASNDDGAIVALGNQLVMFPKYQDIDYITQTENAIFDSSLFISSQITFEEETGGQIKELAITFCDMHKESSELVLNVYILKNKTFDQALLEQWQDANFWNDPDKKVKFTIKTGCNTNTWAAPIDCNCKSFILVIRFGQNPNAQGIRKIQKLNIESIRYTYIPHAS